MLIEKADMYQIFNLFWSLFISFRSYLIDFKFLMKFKSDLIDSVLTDDAIRIQEFRPTMSIERGFESDFKQNLGLSRFICLSLLNEHPCKKQGVYNMPKYWQQ